jgi:Arc/MetJ-type ribon-helix-helix transcriptional regulator
MKTPTVTIRIPQKDLDKMDKLIPGVFRDKTHLIRFAIRELVKHYQEYEESLRGGMTRQC